MHLLDVAALAANLPHDSAISRLRDLHEWEPLATAASVQAVNEIRLLRQQLSDFFGGGYKAELIRPEGMAQTEAGVDVSRLGASDGFDSPDEARQWYLANFPDMADRI